MGNCISNDGTHSGRVSGDYQESHELTRPTRSDARRPPRRTTAGPVAGLGARSRAAPPPRLRAAEGGHGTLHGWIEAINHSARSARPISVADIQSRDVPIPPTVYRAARDDADDIAENGVPSGRSRHQTDDEYLADIIRHTARTGGSGGQVPSFSANQATSSRFLRPGIGMSFVTVDTTRDPRGFRTAANILLHDAERLVQQRLVSPGTVARAIEKLVDENESEVFYVRGNVPHSMIQSASAR